MTLENSLTKLKYKLFNILHVLSNPKISVISLGLQNSIVEQDASNTMISKLWATIILKVIKNNFLFSHLLLKKRKSSNHFPILT